MSAFIIFRENQSSILLLYKTKFNVNENSKTISTHIFFGFIVLVSVFLSGQK